MKTGNQTRAPLRWRWIVSLALSGLVFGLLSVSGLVHGMEGRLVLALLLGCSVTLALVIEHSPIRHGLATGLVFGLLAVWSQALFMNTYLRNNPDYALIELPFGMSPRLLTATLGPLNAVAAALIVAALTWGLWRLRGLISDSPAPRGGPGAGAV